MDTPRQVGVRKPDDSHNLMQIVPGGQQQPAQPGQPQQEVFDPTKGDFDVTISTGMSYQSQRAQASDFVDTLLGELPNLPIAPQAKATLLAKAITLKDIGPIGDEMAKIIDPQGDGEPIQPQAQAAIAQAQAHAQEATQLATQLAQEKQSKMWEHLGKMKEIEAKFQGDMALEEKKLQAQLAVAEIGTKAQNISERMAAVEELTRQLHDQAHDVAMQADAHAKAQELAAQQHQQAQEQMAQQGDQQSQQSAQEAQQQAEQQASQPSE
jgi:hypothetical protein